MFLPPLGATKPPPPPLAKHSPGSKLKHGANSSSHSASKPKVPKAVSGSSEKPSAHKDGEKKKVKKPKEEPSSSVAKKAKSSSSKSASASVSTSNGNPKPVAISSDEDDDLPLAALNKLREPGADLDDLPLSVIRKISPTRMKSKSKNHSPLKKGQSVLDKHFQKFGQSSIQKKPSKKISQYEQPPIVQKIIRVMKEEGGDPLVRQKKIGVLMVAAAKFLNDKQRKRLPESIRANIQEKFERHVERERLKKLTPEERAKEYAKKREEKLRQLKEEQAKIPRPKKHEKIDELLADDIRYLPRPDSVRLPEGVSMDMFGNLVMVVEILHLLREVLAPEGFEMNFSIGILLDALVSGKRGFMYLSSILEMMLRTLLQDDINQHLTDLGTNLNKVSVTSQTASELTRTFCKQILLDTERNLYIPQSEITRVFGNN